MESRFQHKVIEEIKRKYPGAVVLKNDSRHLQGVPDWLILYKQFWASLEIKDTLNSPKQPNQDYWVNVLNQMSYSSFLYPENKLEVLHELQSTLRPDW